MEPIQQRVFDALVERRPDLADMYRVAIDQLRVPSGEVGARTRISYICHSMREVMNRIITAMGRPIAPAVKPSSSDRVQQLPDLLSRFPDLQFDVGQELVPIPREVAVAMESLFRAAVQEKRRSRDDVAALLTDDGNAAHAAVSKWIEARGFFVKWAHIHDRVVPSEELPSDDEIRTHVATFETLVDGVITQFFTARQSIEDLLAEINDKGDTA